MERRGALACSVDSRCTGPGSSPGRFFFQERDLLSPCLSLAMSKNWHRRTDTKKLESMSVFEQQCTCPSPNPILLSGYSFWAKGGVGASSLRCWHWFRISSLMSVCTYCPSLLKHVVENDEKCYISWSAIASRNGRLGNGLDSPSSHV